MKRTRSPIFTIATAEGGRTIPRPKVSASELRRQREELVRKGIGRIEPALKDRLEDWTPEDD